MRRKHPDELYFVGGFPHYLKGFSNGRVSLTVERFGGWDGLRYIRVEKAGQYPVSDQEHLQIFGRTDNSEQDRPLLGAAIRFLCENKAGRVYPFYPQKGMMAPTGFQACCDTDGFKGGYELLLGKQDVAAEFNWKANDRKNFIMAFNKAHLNTLPEPSSFNQIIGDTAARLPEELTCNADPTKPFVTGNVEPTPTGFRFDPAKNAFSFQVDLKYPSWQRTLYAALTSNTPLSFRETNNQWIFIATWGQRTKIRIALALSEENADSAWTEATSAMANFTKKRREEKKSVDAIASKIPSLEIAGLPEAGEFVRVAPHYQESLITKEDDQYASIRSANWRYGACVTWDHTLPIRDFLFSGRWELARKMLEYQAEYPYLECSLCATPFFISQLGEYVAFTGDSESAEKYLPRLETFLRYADRMTDRQTGLIKFSRSLGVDIVDELNLVPPFYAPEINGMFFDAYRVLENLFLRFGRVELASEAGLRADRIEKNLLLKFYSEKDHYLICGLNPDFSIPDEGPVFMNVATMPVHYSYGEFLFRKVLPELADYQANQLYHPCGRVSLSYDSSGNNGVRSTHMNQHLTHLCRVARAAGRTDEAYRVMREYLSDFTRYMNASETFNQFGCDCDVQQKCSWQAFSATAAYGAIVTALAGINWHGGGLYYMPGDDNRNIRFRNFGFGGHVFDFEILGQGAFTEKITINGKSLEGSLQLPGKLPSGNIRCVIRRSSRMFTRPMLLNAVDLKVAVTESSEKKLSFQTMNQARSVVKIFSPARPEMKAGREKILFEWDAANHIVWLDRHFDVGETIGVHL